MFFRKPVSSKTSVMESMRLAPLTLDVMKQHGVTKMGNMLSPLETLETVTKQNGLSEQQLRAIVQGINDSLKQQDDPKLMQGEILVVTPLAAEQLQAFLKRKHEKALRLRLIADTMIYRYDLDATSRKGGGEVEYKTAGLTFYVEKGALPLLKGVRIDFNQRENGFLFQNPNTK